MNKFFRKIRRKYLAESRFGKYFLYAIGEIILVVIGILIALQINNWNEHKKNAQQEQLILTQLLAEYESNHQQIESKIALRNDVIKSCISLLKYIHNRPQNITTDSVDYHLSRVTMRPTFDPQLGVSNELINAGKLYLINNTTLRNRISSYSSFLNELNEEELNIFRFTEEEFYAFLIDQYQVGGFTTQFLFDEELRARFTIGESLSDFSELKNLVPKANFETLLNHPNFEDHITRLLGLTPYTNDQSIGVRNKTQEIIDLINLETAKTND